MSARGFAGLGEGLEIFGGERDDLRDARKHVVEIAGLPIMVYGASAPAMTPEDLSWFVDDTLTRRLLAVPGVAKSEGGHASWSSSRWRPTRGRPTSTPR